MGKVTNKITLGASHENITVLVACNASGKAIDPLVIYIHSLVKISSHHGVSDNGWMNMQVFDQWFEKICSQVTERPLLIIYDGHLSNVSISLIEKARQEDITIFKLPPHVTDNIQSLDALCFGPLK